MVAFSLLTALGGWAQAFGLEAGGWHYLQAPHPAPHPGEASFCKQGTRAPCARHSLAQRRWLPALLVNPGGRECSRLQATRTGAGPGEGSGGGDEGAGALVQVRQFPDTWPLGPRAPWPPECPVEEAGEPPGG